MDVLFDENGYLKPYKPLEMNLTQFRSTFVFNEHRNDLYDEYIEFIRRLKNMPIGHFHQWVNGSFTTRKTFPKDIDFVSFVDSNFYRKFEGRLLSMAEEFKYRHLDAYFEPVFPENHFMSAVTRYNSEDWKQLYGSDRKFRRKGFIQINY